MKDALDFDAINQAALAAFPAVLNRLLPGSKTIGRRDCRAQPASGGSQYRLIQGQPI